MRKLRINSRIIPSRERRLRAHIHEQHKGIFLRIKAISTLVVRVYGQFFKVYLTPFTHEGERTSFPYFKAALLLYFTSRNEKCGIYDAKLFCAVLGRGCKLSGKIIAYGVTTLINSIAGQNFSKISSVLYTSRYLLSYIKK